VGAVELRHRVEDRVDAVLGGVLVALDVEVHERRALVARDLPAVRGPQRRLDVGDRREAAESLHDVLDARAERRVVDRQPGRLRLDEHLLARALVEAGVGQDAIGPTRLAGSQILVGQVLRPDGAADEHARDDERDPAPDRDPAVLGTPPCRALGEIRARWHDALLPRAPRAAAGRWLDPIRRLVGAAETWRPGARTRGAYCLGAGATCRSTLAAAG
jgi:hypothetical protein